MIAFPNAKINLGLNIIKKRQDGYHNIVSCFYPIKWEDVLEVNEGQRIQFSSSGLAIPGNPDNNLCLIAYHLLDKDFNLPPVEVHLHKVIPTGAGLGGGSADGSFMLKLLNNIFKLDLNQEALQGYAAKLGSDCPFFIENKPAMVYGTGDIFHDISLVLSGKFIVLVNPGIHIATAEAYKGVKPEATSFNLAEILESQPVGEWEKYIRNDFEQSLFARYPVIENIKGKLYQEGALYASMTGSGTTVYGLFDREVELNAVFAEEYTVFTTSM